MISTPSFANDNQHLKIKVAESEKREVNDSIINSFRTDKQKASDRK